MNHIEVKAKLDMVYQQAHKAYEQRFLGEELEPLLKIVHAAMEDLKPHIKDEGKHLLAKIEQEVSIMKSRNLFGEQMIPHLMRMKEHSTVLVCFVIEPPKKW